MCEGESWKGAWALLLGVPLYVPVADMLIRWQTSSTRHAAAENAFVDGEIGCYGQEGPLAVSARVGTRRILAVNRERPLGLGKLSRVPKKHAGTAIEIVQLHRCVCLRGIHMRARYQHLRSALQQGKCLLYRTARTAKEQMEHQHRACSPQPGGLPM